LLILKKWYRKESLWYYLTMSSSRTRGSRR